MDDSNLKSYPIRPQNLKTNPTYQSASGCAEPKIAPLLLRCTVIFLTEYASFPQFSFKKVLSELENHGSAIFRSQVRLRIELPRENDRNTSNTGSKGYV